MSKSNDTENPFDTIENKTKPEETKNKPKSLKDSIFSFFIFTNIYVDFVTYFLITFALYCSFLMYTGLESHMKKLQAFNPSFKFPKKEDLYPTIWIFLILIFIHKIFNVLTIDFIEKHLSKRYDEIDEINIYKNKVSTNVIKLFLYFSSSVIGYYALRDLEFFPWTLGGTGEFKNIFTKGFPEYLFFKKTELFNFYYNYNLAFALLDTYILISFPSQTDFLLMILHHIVTVNLVVFSFLTNMSHIGSIVYFTHYSSDILGMVIRILIHLDVSEIYSCYFTFAFLFIFIYNRLFVFGDVIYQTYSFVLFYDYNIYPLYLCGFLAVIMTLNLIWIVLISKKTILFLITGRIEEIYKLKKVGETKKAK